MRYDVIFAVNCLGFCVVLTINRMPSSKTQTKQTAFESRLTHRFLRLFLRRFQTFFPLAFSPLPRFDERFRQRFQVPGCESASERKSKIPRETLRFTQRLGTPTDLPGIKAPRNAVRRACTFFPRPRSVRPIWQIRARFSPGKRSINRMLKVGCKNRVQKKETHSEVLPYPTAKVRRFSLSVGERLVGPSAERRPLLNKPKATWNAGHCETCFR